MTTKITVSPQFKKDFDEYCALYHLDKYDIEYMRDCVRENFNHTGKYIERHMAVHRWMISLWGFVPRYDLLVGYLESKKIFINTKIYGFALLAGFCYDAAMSEKDVQNSDNT